MTSAYARAREGRLLAIWRGFVTVAALIALGPLWRHWLRREERQPW